MTDAEMLEWVETKTLVVHPIKGAILREVLYLVSRGLMDSQGAYDYALGIL